MESKVNKEISKMYKVIVWCFLIGNLFAALASCVVLLLTPSSSDPISIFEYTRVPLYFIDAFALYLLLKPNSLGFRVLISTSVLNCLANWYNGIIVSDIFQAFGTAEFYIFASTATVLPFIDIALLYFVGKEYITKRSCVIQKAPSKDKDNSSTSPIIVIVLITFGVVLLPIILFLILILSLEYGPGGFKI